MKAFMYMGYIKFDVSFSPKLSTVSVDKKNVLFFKQMNNHKTWKSFIDFETKRPYFRTIKPLNS